MAQFISRITKIRIANPFTDIKALTLFNFFILLFFSFFGTELPFRELTYERFEVESTNIVNQVVYGYLLLSAVLVLIQNSRNTFNFIQKEKFLTSFILLCLISSFWSNYSFISIKRSSQLVATFLTILNVIMNSEFKQIISVLKIISVLYLTVTYISGLLVPQAIDPDFGTWRGIELQKNGLGQAGICILAISLFFDHKGSNTKIFFNYLITLSAAGIIILSDSSSNIIALFLIIVILITFYIDKVFRPIGYKRIVSLLVVFFSTLIVIYIFLFPNELADLIPGLFGKDLTFTGRTLIWHYLMQEVSKKLLFGYGFGTYWILGTSVIYRFQTNVGWMVNEAHNGYIEIMLQLGLIGLVLFFILIIVLFRRILKINNNAAIISLISILIINITESLIFRYRGALTVIFIFVYLYGTFYYFYPNPFKKTLEL